MRVQEIRIQSVGTGKNSPRWLAAIFQIIVSLEDFDNTSTDSARIALIDQIIASINAVRA